MQAEAARAHGSERDCVSTPAWAMGDCRDEALCEGCEVLCDEELGLLSALTSRGLHAVLAEIRAGACRCVLCSAAG